MMTTEREVSVLLKVKRDSQNGKAFSDLSKSAKGLTADTDRAGKAVTDLLKQFKADKDAVQHVDRVTKGLRQMGIEATTARAAAQRLMKDVGDGARIGRAEIDRMAMGLKQVSQATGASGRAGGGHGNIVGMLASLGIAGRIGGMAGRSALPLAALGAINAGVGFAQSTVHPEEGLSGRRMQDALIRKSMELPLIGHLLGQSNEAQALRERDRRLSEARESVGYTEQRLNSARPFREQREALERQQAGIEDRAGMTPAQQRLSFGIAQRTQGQTEAAMDAARRSPGQSPAEVAARHAFGASQEQLHLSQAGEAMQAKSEQERAQMDVMRKRRARDAQRHQESIAAAEINRGGGVVNEMNRPAFGGRSAIGAIFGQGIPNVVPGPSVDERNRRRAVLEEQQARSISAQNDLVQAQGRLLDANNKIQEMTLAHGQQRIDQLNQERTRLTGVIEAEKEREKGVKQSFGRLKPYEQARAARIAETLAAGGQVNRRDLEFGSGIAGLEKLTGAAFEQRANNPNFDRFAGASELGRQQREAREGRAAAEDAIGKQIDVNAGLKGPLKEAGEARLQIENKIQVEINVNAQSVADQLLKTLTPQILQFMTDLQNASNTARDKLENERRANQGNQAGGF